MSPGSSSALLGAAAAGALAGGAEACRLSSGWTTISHGCLGSVTVDRLWLAVGGGPGVMCVHCALPASGVQITTSPRVRALNTSEPANIGAGHRGARGVSASIAIGLSVTVSPGYV